MSVEYAENVVKRFRIKVEKWETRQVQLWYDNFILDLDNWKDDVQFALSVPLRDPPNKVTRDRSRLFPYMRSGSLKNSIQDAGLDAHTTKAGNKSINIRVRVDDTKAFTTNFGIKAPKTAKQGAWVGWWDDVFSGKGRGSVETSVHEIFRNVTRKRAEF